MSEKYVVTPQILYISKLVINLFWNVPIYVLFFSFTGFVISRHINHPNSSKICRMETGLKLNFVELTEDRTQDGTKHKPEEFCLVPLGQRVKEVPFRTKVPGTINVMNNHREIKRQYVSNTLVKFPLFTIFVQYTLRKCVFTSILIITDKKVWKDMDTYVTKHWTKSEWNPCLCTDVKTYYKIIYRHGTKLVEGQLVKQRLKIIKTF